MGIYIYLSCCTYFKEAASHFLSSSASLEVFPNLVNVSHMSLFSLQTCIELIELNNPGLAGDVCGADN